MEVNEAKLDFWKKVGYIFIKPTKAMDEIKRNPVLKEAFIIIIVFAIFSGYIAIPVSDIVLNELSAASINKYGTDFYEELRMQGQREDVMPPTAFAIFTAINALTMCVVESLVWLLIIRIFKGNGTYRQLLSMFAHIYIFVYIKNCVIQYFQYRFQTGRNLFSLQLFMEADRTNFFYNLFSKIGVFEIWQALIVAGGLAVIAGFSQKKSLAISIAVTLFVAAVMAFNATLF